MIIDSHCHLDYEPMYSSLDDVISRADKSQIKYILTISVKDNKYKNILENTQKSLIVAFYLFCKFGMVTTL